MPAKLRLQDISELVDGCIRDVGSEADGFPVETLLRDLLVAYPQGPQAREEMMAVVDRQLSFWIATLERDMQAMASPSPAVIVSIKARMHAAQRALLHVQSTLGALRRWLAADAETARGNPTP